MTFLNAISEGKKFQKDTKKLKKVENTKNFNTKDDKKDEKKLWKKDKKKRISQKNYDFQKIKISTVMKKNPISIEKDTLAAIKPLSALFLNV